MNTLTVIIPTRNADNVRVSVPAVRKHEPDASIIIVDDGADWSGGVPAAFNGVQLVTGDKPFNFSRNANIGINTAALDDVVLLNDDAILESPGGFTLMQQAAESDISVGIIGAVTNLTGQPLQQPRQKYIGDPVKDRINPDYGLRQVEHFAFVCVFIPRRTVQYLKRVSPLYPDLISDGLLDERYCVDYGVQDRDLCQQVTHVGLKVCVLDSCFVDHSKLHSTYRGDPEAPKSFQGNLKLFNAKWNLDVR